MIPDTIRTAIDAPLFREGWRWGLAALAAAAAIGLVTRWVRHRPAPVAGVLAVGAFAVAIDRGAGLPDDVAVGLGLLALAGLASGLLAMWKPVLGWLGAVAAVPGALVLANTRSIPTAGWVGPLVAVTAVAGGALMADFDRRHRDVAWTPALYALAVVGVYYTVPDTERALVLLGAVLPVVLAGWPTRLAATGAAGAYACAGALAWVAAADGRGRPGSIVGGVACLGLLVAEPLACLVARHNPLRRLDGRWWGALAVGGLQLGLVFIASRIAGLRDGAAAAAAISGVALAVTVVILVSAAEPVAPDP